MLRAGAAIVAVLALFSQGGARVTEGSTAGSGGLLLVATFLAGKRLFGPGAGASLPPPPELPLLKRPILPSTA